METGLAGKGVVVTGASGGIGAACARLFAAEGAKVLVHYHHGAERADAIAAEIGGAPTAQADLRVEAEVDRLFEAARAPSSARSTSAPRSPASGRPGTCPCGSSRSSAGRRRSGKT
jgi:NAD(P)-dependent dehydrogenase (short-subunit alcohol dehydrogenase family)